MKNQFRILKSVKDNPYELERHMLKFQILVLSAIAVIAIVAFLSEI